MTRKQFSIEKGDFYTQYVKKMVIFVSINARANNVLGLKIKLIINKKFLKHPVRVIDSLVNICYRQSTMKYPDKLRYSEECDFFFLFHNWPGSKNPKL